MPDPGSIEKPNYALQRCFATTLWNVVVAAGESSPAAREAMEKLCRTYWYPLYFYVRRRGKSAQDAQDLTQAFFARFLEKSSVSRADRQRGPFRAFLLAALRNFLTDEWKRKHAEKRGGGRLTIPWVGQSPEVQYQHEPASNLTLDKSFDQRWASALFQKAFSRLRDEFAASGKSQEFKLLKRFLSAEPVDGEYAALGPRLGLTAAMVSLATHRLRRRYGELVRQEIAATVTDRAEIEAEMRYLIALVSE
jgi:DNA-directed RNA polymerase specialized sigma24 family protein